MNDIEAIMRAAPVIPVIVIDDLATAQPAGRGAGRGRTARARSDDAHAGRARRDPRDEVGPRRDRRRGHGGECRAVRSGDGRRRRVHRLARPDRAAGRADHRQRRAVPARHRQFGRHHARARSRPDALQVLPCRGEWRVEGAQEPRRALLPVQVLPDRRGQRSEAPEWLAFEPVLCVGGSWVCSGTPEEVEAKARAAADLRR